MFALSPDPLHPEELKTSLDSPGAGAFVFFEGRVRDASQGRDVSGLEYSAYEELARSEGLKIVEAAIKKFGLLAARCVHRTGRLEIGDVAIWVGVCSAHRADGFDACRHIIDEVKHRVPIWKKEYYSDGDSGWVNSTPEVTDPLNRS